MPKPTRWACTVCDREYHTEKEAIECEAVPLAPPMAKVGDIVIVGKCFGWYDGDRRWIANADKVDPKRTGSPFKMGGRKCPRKNSNCFSDCCNFSFYYVVTAIDRRNTSFVHDNRYFLRTLAMKPANGYSRSWTSDRGHWAPTVVKNPPAAVVKAAKAFIGETPNRLL